VLLCTLAAPLAAYADTAKTGSQYSPTFAPGGIVAWLVCNAQKRNPIGGWLLYFYWQLYSGLIITGVFFAINIQSYVPENFDSSTKFGMFLASAVPGIVLYVAKCAIATLLLSARTWDMLKLLRWIMAAELVADVLATVIDANYFPDNLPLNFLTIIPGLVWLAYMFRSVRVRHVFYLHDWDTAVNTIHPIKLKVAT
jgi:hypothetical protein